MSTCEAAATLRASGVDLTRPPVVTARFGGGGRAARPWPLLLAGWPSGAAFGALVCS